MSDSPAPSSAGGPARAVLLALAAGFVAFGVAFLLAPAKLAATVDLTAGSKAALVELRAFYGGVELGFGAFLALAALKKEWQVPGLTAALLTLVGVAGSRIYGLSVEGSAGAMVYLFLAVELAGAVAAGFGLVQAKRPPEAETTADAPALTEADKTEVIDKTVPIERTKLIERTVRMERRKTD